MANAPADLCISRFFYLDVYQKQGNMKLKSPSALRTALEVKAYYRHPVPNRFLEQY
jgi:hypothetical protein